jgi:hypothetical protein
LTVTDPGSPFSDAQPTPETPVTKLPTGLEPRRKAGRPLLLTEAVHDAIVTAVEQGSYLKVAAQAAGISQATLASWLARGREAAAARDRHDPEHLYCPHCTLDRTTAAYAVEEHNRAEAARPRQPTDPPRAYATHAPCPECRTDEPPAPWTLPDTEAPFLALLEEVTRAQAVAEVSAVTAWRTAFGTDWRAARDYLARTAPERWAGVTRVQMTTEEAERRIDDAVNEALLSVGVDMPHADPLDDALDEGLDP